jgi:chromatin remodeling complex protein RSC6
MSTAAKTTARKTTKKETAAAAAAAPAPAAPVAPAPVAPAPVAAPAEVAVAAPVEEVNVVAEFNSLVTKVASLREVFASVLSDMKKLEKRIPRELKKASKKRKGAKAADGDKPKRESIFKKPVQISDDLCVFLGKPKGTLMSRSDVTTAVCTYARTNGLMNKQVINADAPLRKLLNITEKDPELMILNLQRFLKPHYIKSA